MGPSGNQSLNSTMGLAIPTILLMPSRVLKRKLATVPFQKFIVCLDPLCQSSELRAWKFGKRAQVETMETHNDDVDNRTNTKQKYPGGEVWFRCHHVLKRVADRHHVYTA